MMGDTATGHADAGGFWVRFGERAEAWRSRLKTGDLKQVFEEIDGLLRQTGHEFCCEVTELGEDAALILTPEGDPEQASKIDALIAGKPSLEGWQVFFG